MLLEIQLSMKEVTTVKCKIGNLAGDVGITNIDLVNGKSHVY